MTLSTPAMLWVSLLVLLSCSQHAQAQIRIELRATTIVDGAVYRLSDIANVQSDNAALRQTLEHIVIGRSPKVGHMGYVSRVDLEARIGSVLASQAVAVDWRGASIVKVKTKGREISRDKLIAAADDALRHWLVNRVGEASMHRVSEVAPVLAPEGVDEVRAYLPETAQLTSKMCVWVDVVIAGRHYQTIPVWFDVSAVRQVYRVVKDLEPGHVLVPDDLDIVKADIATVKGQAWALQDDLQGQRTTRWMAASSVLTQEALEPVPDVVKGERVIVTATSGPVALQVSAVALKDGNMNDVIPVTRRLRQDEFQVLVTGKGQAVVADATINEE